MQSGCIQWAQYFYIYGSCPRLGNAILGVPVTRTISVFCVLWGSHYFGNYHMYVLDISIIALTFINSLMRDGIRTQELPSMKKQSLGENYCRSLNNHQNLPPAVLIELSSNVSQKKHMKIKQAGKLDSNPSAAYTPNPAQQFSALCFMGLQTTPRIHYSTLGSQSTLNKPNKREPKAR